MLPIAPTEGKLRRSSTKSGSVLTENAVCGQKKASVSAGFYAVVQNVIAISSAGAVRQETIIIRSLGVAEDLFDHSDLLPDRPLVKNGKVCPIQVAMKASEYHAVV